MAADPRGGAGAARTAARHPAKPGKRWEDADGVLRTAAHKPGWVLCVGAGISMPAFPSWPELAERMVAKDLGAEAAKAVVAKLRDVSQAAMLQAAQARLGLDDASFAKALADELYSPLLQQVPAAFRRKFLRMLAADPTGMRLADWERFVSLLEAAFPRLNAVPLARLLCRLHGTALAPKAVLSFNAEPLLYALTNAYTAIEHGRQRDEGRTDVSRARRIDLVLRAVSQRRPDRIPLFCCHGLLPPPGTDEHVRAASPEKLVFSEADYLGLSGQAFSWQAAVFVESCMFHTMVFVGMSLTDPNVRRWLSWVHENRRAEVDRLGRQGVPSSAHYWIRTTPGDRASEEWLEASVAHLGLRIVWLNGWGELEAALDRMLDRHIGPTGHPPARAEASRPGPP